MAQPARTPQPAVNYPMTLSVDYPDRNLNRLTTFFRVFTIIPIAIVSSLLEGGIVFPSTLLMVLFRQKYPRWWFDWNYALVKFSTRVAAYFALLRDEYPSTDEDQAIHIDMVYPNAKEELDRWLPLVKWFLAIPHYVVLAFLGLAGIVVVVIAWFAILFTRRYPKGLFEFVVGVFRWYLRVLAYAFLLVTDQYPPFRLDP